MNTSTNFNIDTAAASVPCRVLTRQECLDLLESYGTPSHVIAHCKAVAEVAVKVGRALNSKGYHLNIGLAENAALLHDMARVKDEHWNVAADCLEKLGLPAQAGIVRKHMFYDPFSPLDMINETDLVCLGDRTVKEGEYVGIDERFDYIIKKPHNLDISVKQRILARKEDMKIFLHGIEEIIGCSLDELMGVKD